MGLKNKVKKENHTDIEFLSTLLDSQFRLPFGFKIGFDGLLGLIPGFGDLIANFIGSYIVLRAIRSGVSGFVVFRMILNLFFDFLLGSLPILGDLFDFFFKANLKNAELLKSYQTREKETKVSSILVVILNLGLLFGLVVASFYSAYIVIQELFKLFHRI
ncbi:MAG: DUF4112 domain-containing protein [Bdellovibrionota bacterium]|nr:DUF4112 domain-containing protein [Bdellovibrionota bacterium]